MRKTRRHYPVLGCLALAASLVTALPAQATGQVRVRVAVPGTGSGQVAGADTGPTDPAEPITAQVFLAGNATDLAAYARGVSDPANPAYGHYLTPDQERARFGPTFQQTATVTTWLRAAGLSVISTTSHAVTVRGTAAEATTAFGTRLENHRANGTVVHAPAGAVTVPAAVAPDVLTVTGLNTAPSSTSSTETAPTSAAGTPGNPCPAYYGQAPATDLPLTYGHPAQWAPCGYVPRQLRGAYGIAGTGLTGKGVTIAIIGAGDDDNALADANRNSAEHGEPSFAPGQFTSYVPAGVKHSPSGGEGTLDIEGAHSMAPGANIAYVICPPSSNGQGVLGAMTQIVDRHLADIVSGSAIVGLLPGTSLDSSTIAAYEQVFLQAAVEGISVIFAAGDSGGDLYDGVLHVGYPASSPWVTAVGGTTLAIGDQDRYLWETDWAEDKTTLSEDGTSWSPSLPGYQGKASGGGVSTVFPQPSYQRGVVSSALAGPTPMRTIPDVAAFADYTIGLQIGMTEVDKQGNYTYVHALGGGTSLATPLFAGFEALAVQERHGAPLGFLNPALYHRYGSADFHHILANPAGTADTITIAGVSFGQIQVETPGQDADSNLTYAPGYDTVTGLGSPTRALLDSFRSSR